MPNETLGQRAAKALKQAKVKAQAEGRTLSWDEVAFIIDSCAPIPGEPTPGEFGDPKKIPPTPDQVTRYAKSRGFDLDGQHFCDHYESKGWLVGKARRKDCQAAVRTWQRTGYTNGRKATVSAPTTYNRI